MRSSKRKAEVNSSIDLSGDVVPGAGKDPRRFSLSQPAAEKMDISPIKQNQTQSARSYEI